MIKPGLKSSAIQPKKFTKRNIKEEEIYHRERILFSSKKRVNILIVYKRREGIRKHFAVLDKVSFIFKVFNSREIKKNIDFSLVYL